MSRTLACGLFTVPLLLATATALAQAPAAPTFSVPRGFHDAPFEVTLTTDVPDASIRYTTDGTEPSASVGETYAGPISITTTTPLRAVAISEAGTSPVTTHTYIFLADVRHQPDAPAGYPDTFGANDGEGPYPADYGMDPEVLEDPAYRDLFDGAMKSIPTLALTTDPEGIFGLTSGIYYHSRQKGTAWERPVSFEWIDPALGEHFGLNAGARIHGQSSRRPARTPKKSLRIYFRAEYGEGKLEHALFAQPAPELATTGAASKFNRIILRAGGNRSWPFWESDQRANADYVNDEWARIAFRDMGHLAPYGGSYVHLYINGLYWGLYNATERIEEDFLITHVGGRAGEYDLIAPDEDTEPSYIPTASAGTEDAWNELLSLVESGPISDDTYTLVEQRLDTVNLADYIIMTHYVGNGDWPIHNWYAYRRLVGDDTRFRIIPWDNDSGLWSVSKNITQADAEGSPARLFHRLMTHPRFRALVGDRLALHTSGTGALSPQRCAMRYAALTTLIDQAIIGESARWGDYSRDVYHRWSDPDSLPAALYTRNDFWVPVRDKKLEEYCPERGSRLVEQYVENGWYEPRLLAPTFSQVGGAVPTGFTLEIRGPDDEAHVLYTLDGSDPRSADGSASAAATTGGAVVNVGITEVTTVSARVKRGETWSPLAQATFHTPQDFSRLVINELHYSPHASSGEDPQAYEFLELHNRGNVTLHLDGARFTRGISYAFARGATIEGGGFLVLAADALAFEELYGFAPDAAYRGQLANGGEIVELVDGTGALIDRVWYGAVAPWPVSADARGPSLELRDPAVDNGVGGNWHASANIQGTPRAPNSPGRDETGSSSSSGGAASSSSSSLAGTSTGASASSSGAGSSSGGEDTTSSSSAAASSGGVGSLSSSGGWSGATSEPERDRGSGAAVCACRAAGDAAPMFMWLALGVMLRRVLRRQR